MLTDVGTWTNWLTFEPDPVNPDAGTDCFLRYRISHATQNFTSGKSDVYVLVAAARRGFTMVLFTEAVSRRNTFVGGTLRYSNSNKLQVRSCTRRSSHVRYSDSHLAVVANVIRVYLTRSPRRRDASVHHISWNSSGFDRDISRLEISPSNPEILTFFEIEYCGRRRLEFSR